MRAGDGVRPARRAGDPGHTFPAPVVARPPMLGVNAVMGNFGMSVPFQELHDTRYPVVPLADLSLDDFDAVMIPGAFCPLELPGRRLAGGAVPARRRGRQGGGGHLPRAVGGWPPPTWSRAAASTSPARTRCSAALTQSSTSTIPHCPLSRRR